MSGTARHLFTSESVTEGHPDKIADQISDAILDALLAKDPMSRVACETLVTTGLAIVAGEITTTAVIDYQEVVRGTIREIGYDRGKYGYDADTAAVLSSIHSQSPDIAMGVDTGGAGDQGLMFGFACNETPELMPLPIMLAHKLVRGLSTLRRDGTLKYLRPDGKSQVTVDYEGTTPVRVDAVVVSSQHSPDVSQEQMRADVIEKIVNCSIPAALMDKDTKIYVNPTGRFVVGGPHGDAGRDGAEDHRGHLRRGGAARRRGVLGQGSDQGGSVGVLHGALHCEERGGGGAGGPGAGAAGVCDWRGGAGVGDGADGRDGAHSGGEDHGVGASELQADAARHRRRAQSAPADLQADRGVRPLRPHRAGIHLGTHRQGRRPQDGAQASMSTTG